MNQTSRCDWNKVWWTHKSLQLKLVSPIKCSVFLIFRPSTDNSNCTRLNYTDIRRVSDSRIPFSQAFT